MRNSELSWNVTVSYTTMSKFNDSMPDHFWQGSTVNKRSSKLIDSTMAWKKNWQGSPIFLATIRHKIRFHFFSMFEVWDSGWPTHIQWLFGNNNVLLKNMSELGQKNGNYVRFFFLTNLSYLSFLCPKFDIFSKVIQTDNEYGRGQNLNKQIPVQRYKIMWNLTCVSYRHLYYYGLN